MSNGVVAINFTIGFGNNIFQYCYGRLLAEKNNLKLMHDELPGFLLPASTCEVDRSLPTKFINDSNCLQELMIPQQNTNIVVNGYFEDYTLYQNDIERIKSWFPKQQKINNEDLILHFRLQNRLVQKTHCTNHVPFEVFELGISKFKFNKLHIVTDSKKWDHYTREDVEEIQKEILYGPNPPAHSPWVDTQYSIDYMNSLIDGFSKYDLVVHCNDAPTIEGSGGLRDDFMTDFNLIRQFDKIMFKDSTFSWWAAVLSDASQVSPYGPWKPNKGVKNKNLGNASFKGWSPWGLQQ